MAQAQQSLKSAGGHTNFVCAAISQHRKLLAKNSSYRYNRQAVEQVGRLLDRGAQDLAAQPVLIPCVFHVVYNTDEQNISEAQIDSQVEVLNNDFNAKNADLSEVPAAFKNKIGNPNVSFFRAKRDPDGKATNGITRTKTSKTGFPILPSGDTDESVKSSSSGGADPWSPDRYLNIWICNFGDGLLGYAQFPGGPRATDGVVIQYTAFGNMGTAKAPFNLGRTATHEVGHWLDLYHIWGDDGTQCSGTDNNADTPNQAGPSSGVPKFPKVTCSNGPNGDMFMNYMDYSDDTVTVMFTKGQMGRIRAALAGPRVALTQSSFQEMFLHLETPDPVVADNNTKFLMGKSSGDAKSDLFIIRPSSTDSKKTTFSVLTSKSSYKNRHSQEVISFETTSPGSCDYGLADWTGDGTLDLFIINKGGNKKEVVILSGGKDEFQKKLLEKAIALPDDGGDWTFCISDRKENAKPDLFCIKPAASGSNKTQIHVLSGDSDFQKSILEASTTLIAPINDDNKAERDFLLTDYNGDGTSDLVAIWKSATNNSRTRIQVLSGLLEYQQYLFESEIALKKTSEDYDFLLTDWTNDGRPDLVAVKKRGCKSEKVEVHIMAG